MNNAGEKWQLAPKVSDSLSVNTAGEVCTIINLQTGHTFVINGVAQRIIELCDGRRTVEEIGKLITDEFHAAASEKIVEDIDHFLAKAFQKDLISWC